MTTTVPSTDKMPPTWGGPLTEPDYSTLLNSWITQEIADAAMLRRVNEQEGREVIGQKGKRDCSGILFPYYWPGEAQPVSYRLRRDHPEPVQGKDGALKPDRKYLGAPGGGNRLYIPPGVTAQHLADVKTPIAVAEGEKKALALWRLANHESSQPRFIPVAIPGVWNWRGTIGKTGGPNGERLDIKGPIADLSRIDWDGRTTFIIFDSNVHTNDSVKWARKGLGRELISRAAKVKLVNLPEDCGVNGIDDLLAAWGPARVLELIAGAVNGDLLHVVPSPQFQARAEGMFRRVQRGAVLQVTQLTNYKASIIANVLLDDGLEARREFEIETDLLGKLSTITISASEFTAMEWAIKYLGSVAITFPNQREYARAAIQFCSMAATERRVYTHTGWRKIDGRWSFLHARGAVGEKGEVSGIEVRLGGALSRYELGLPAAGDLQNAVRASLRLVGLGSPSIGFPLLAATYRAVIGDADFALHLAGETGAFKSELAALFQRHFGSEMNRLHLPASWSSTPNSLEMLAFEAKDVLLVIDDFAPHGNASDIARHHSAADRVFRSAGNRAARGRLDSTAKLRESKPPRGLILSTGEDIPNGHSVRARLLILELSKGAIGTSDLTACQEDASAGLFVHAMTGFITWIAADYERIHGAFRRRVAELRLDALQNVAHARTPDIVANLQAAFHLFLEFGVSCGAVGNVERDRLANECWSALSVAAGAQAKHQAGAEPTARYLGLLRACLTSGRAHLQSMAAGVPERSPESCGWRFDNESWKSQGDCIGWVDGDAIYLEPAATYRVIQVMARDMNETLATSEQTMKKRLSEKGLLASTDSKRETLTVRRTIGGSQKRVLHFLRHTLLPETPNDEESDVR